SLGAIITMNRTYSNLYPFSVGITQYFRISTNNTIDIVFSTTSPAGGFGTRTLNIPQPFTPVGSSFPLLPGLNTATFTFTIPAGDPRVMKVEMLASPTSLDSAPELPLKL